jgi:hypothetical protein
VDRTERAPDRGGATCGGLPVGIVALVEGAGAPDEPEGGGGRGARTPPEAPDRPWRHPSEIGLDAREQSDRRRGMGMALGFVAVAGVVLLGVAALTNLGSADSDTRESQPVAPSPLSAIVTVDSGNGAWNAIAAVLEGGRHAMASGAELGNTDGASISVTSGADGSAATVVATDDGTDMVLLELDDPFPVNGIDRAEVEVGGDFLFTFLDHMGHVETDAVAVSSTDAQALRSDGTPVSGVMGLEGWTDHQGPLTDSQGRFAGWVFPAKGAQMFAYDASYVAALADRMAGTG